MFINETCCILLQAPLTYYCSETWTSDDGITAKNSDGVQIGLPVFPNGVVKQNCKTDCFVVTRQSS